MNPYTQTFSTSNSLGALSSKQSQGLFALLLLLLLDLAIGCQA